MLIPADLSSVRRRPRATAAAVLAGLLLAANAAGEAAPTTEEAPVLSADRVVAAAEPERRARLIAEGEAKMHMDPSDVYVLPEGDARYDCAREHSLASVAAARGVSPVEAFLDLVAETDGAVNLNYPIRIRIGRKTGQGHYQALVGYDTAVKKFTFVESSGDRAHAGGIGTYTFDQVDGVLNANETVTHGEIVEIHPPRPVPAARIKVTHENRMNVHLWLSVSDSPLPRRQIWPPLQAEDHHAAHGAGRWLPWDDNSRNLHYTVRLPTELIWPPTKSNRVVLDVYDSGAHSDLGGAIDEFTVAFGAEVLSCPQLTTGPVALNARSHAQLTIP